jgi:hypothetical protein
MGCCQSKEAEALDAVKQAEAGHAEDAASSQDVELVSPSLFALLFFVSPFS